MVDLVETRDHTFLYDTFFTLHGRSKSAKIGLFTTKEATHTAKLELSSGHHVSLFNLAKRVIWTFLSSMPSTQEARGEEK